MIPLLVIEMHLIPLQGKMVTSMTGGVAGGQAIKVVQGAQPGIKVAQANLGQTAVIGGQIRLASPGKLAIELSFKQKNG